MEQPQCQCSAPGHCPLLRRECDPPAGRKMSATRHDECQNKPHYFEMFLSETKKPCRNRPSEPLKPQLTWDWQTLRDGGPCRHIGETLRTVECKPCGGVNTAEVRACEIHGECTWRQGVRSQGEKGKMLKACLNCRDYLPPDVPIKTACEHLGEPIRSVEVKSGCCGHEEVQVFACGLHQECTINNRGARSENGRRILHACQTCPDSTVEIRDEPPKPKPIPQGQNGKPKKAPPPKPKAKPPRKVTGLLVTADGRKADCLMDSYKGCSVFLLCGGPSLAQMPLEQLNQTGIMVAAVNSAANLYRPHLWFMVDEPKKEFPESLWRDPAVMKFTRADHKRKRLKTPEGDPGSLMVHQCPGTYFFSVTSGFTPESFLDKPNPAWEIRAGKTKRSVMLVAVRLLYWLGFRTVYLLGADFHYRPEKTYADAPNKGSSDCGSNNNTMHVLNEWFHRLRPEFEKRGFHIYNSTPQSRLTAFDYVDFEAAVTQCSLSSRPPATGPKRLPSVNDG